MSDASVPADHSHVFLGDDHALAERRTSAVIALCGCATVAEIVGGWLFGSIALVADGLHMSTHAGALLLAALAYRCARRYRHDPRFSFGTGKLGDLAGFSSAVVLATVALLIGYEAVGRLFQPVPIRFGEAIPIACLSLAVNVGSVWLLNGGFRHHHHGRGDGHGHHAGTGAEARRVATPDATLLLAIAEHDGPPVFRLRVADGALPDPEGVSIETERSDGARAVFAMARRGDWLQSVGTVPEPHSFTARVRVNGRDHAVSFAAPDHHHRNDAAHRDNNLRAAIVHVLADAAVSVLVIVGLLLARICDWTWMDPLAGIVGAGVIAAWSYRLLRDTGAILLDMTPDRDLQDGIRRTVEGDGDRLADFHLWRLGPGHLGAILSVVTAQPREAGFYRERLASFHALSHVTVEVRRIA